MPLLPAKEIDMRLVALVGLVGAVGDIIYCSAVASGVDTWSKLAGNTANDRRVLVSNGNGTTALAPAWNANAFWKDIDQTLEEGVDITVGATTGTKIGTATTQKLGFFGATPVVQQTALTAADAGTIDGTYGAEEQAILGNIRTRLGELETKLIALGFIAAP